MSPAAASAEPTAGQGYHAEAIKTIDETTLLIPSQLNRGVEDGDAFPEARTLGFAETLGRGGRTVLESDGKSGLSGQQIAECARLLGIDVIFDTDILYIAEELLTSPLPGASAALLRLPFSGILGGAGRGNASWSLTLPLHLQHIVLQLRL